MKFAGNEVVQRVALQHRKAHIHHGAQQAADDHRQQQPAERLQVGSDPRYAEEGQGHIFIRIFHYACTSSVLRAWILLIS